MANTCPDEKINEHQMHVIQAALHVQAREDVHIAETAPLGM
jgi:hypothetical protein